MPSPTDIIFKVEQIVKKACRSKANYFKASVWEDHFIPVVTYARKLAHKLKADEEIVMLAALLHDYASVTNKEWVEKHHLVGARLAGEILEKYHYPSDKIERVKHAILTHRGSQKLKRKTLEAEILASADAMAHLAHVHSLFHLAYSIKKLETEEGRMFVLAKVKQSYQKLLPEARKIIQPKHDAIVELLEKKALG